MASSAKSKKEIFCKGFNSTGCHFGGQCNKVHYAHPQSLNHYVLKKLDELSNQNNMLLEIVTKNVQSLKHTLWTELSGISDQIMELKVAQQLQHKSPERIINNIYNKPDKQKVNLQRVAALCDKITVSNNQSNIVPNANDQRIGYGSAELQSNQNYYNKSDIKNESDFSGNFRVDSEHLNTERDEISFVRKINSILNSERWLKEYFHDQRLLYKLTEGSVNPQNRIREIKHLIHQQLNSGHNEYTTELYKINKKMNDFDFNSIPVCLDTEDTKNDINGDEKDDESEEYDDFEEKDKIRSSIQLKKQLILQEILCNRDKMKIEIKNIQLHNINPLNAFKQTICQIFDIKGNENDFHTSYGYSVNMMRFIFIIWLFCVSYVDLGHYDDDELGNVLLEFDQEINNVEHFQIVDGYETLGKLNNFIESRYDITDRFSDIWGITKDNPIN